MDADIDLIQALGQYLLQHQVSMKEIKFYSYVVAMMVSELRGKTGEARLELLFQAYNMLAPGKHTPH